MIAERDRLAMKARFRVLVDAVGDIDTAALITGAGKGTLSKAYSPQYPDMPTVDRVASLEAASGKPHMTALLARLSGHVLLPIPVEHGPAGEALAEVLRDAGELGGRVAIALGDGELSADEIASLLDGLGELARAVSHAQAVLSSRSKE
jgi:hypothetical protein